MPDGNRSLSSSSRPWPLRVRVDQQSSLRDQSARHAHRDMAEEQRVRGGVGGWHLDSSHPCGVSQQGMHTETWHRSRGLRGAWMETSDTHGRRLSRCLCSRKTD